jgi:very-short-patch-repair endonuclease
MPAVPFDAAIIFLSCGGVLLLIVLVWVIRSLLEPTVQVEPVQSLLTPAEQRFYQALDAAIDGRLAILSKVRIADLFNVASSNRTARQRVFRSIASKHVDFVLAEPADLHPVAAIELDDSSHDRSDRRLRDRMLDELFDQAGFPLIRFRVTAKFDPRWIEAQVGEVVSL